MENQQELIEVFKALADASRLKIIGLLANQAYSVEELAALLGLKPSTVSHHLAKLAGCGLVSARAESYYNVYSLNSGALEALSRRLLSAEQVSAAAAELDLNAYDAKVLNAYLLPDGRLKTIPAQRKKLEAVLRHLAGAFEPDQRYTEKQVNEILSRFHEDTASLRRELVGSGLMSREGGGGEYWKN